MVDTNIGDNPPDLLRMEEQNQNGISAITAATMIATGAIGNQTAPKSEPRNGDSSERRLSLWELIKNMKHDKREDREGKIESIMDINQHEADPKTSRRESLSNIVSALSSAYATILICTYIAFSFTELVTFPAMYRWLDIHGFFVYLYLCSNIYLLYLLSYVIQDRDDSSTIKNPKFVENLTVRDNRFMECTRRQASIIETIRVYMINFMIIES